MVWSLKVKSPEVPFPDPHVIASAPSGHSLSVGKFCPGGGWFAEWSLSVSGNVGPPSLPVRLGVLCSNGSSKMQRKMAQGSSFLLQANMLAAPRGPLTVPLRATLPCAGQAPLLQGLPVSPSQKAASPTQSSSHWPCGI